MEPLDAATRQAFKTALEELLTPRDEAIEYQKAHEEILGQAYGENILKHPLALLPSDLEIPQTDNASSSRLEELINTNVRLNKELRQLQEPSRISHDAPDQHTHNASRHPAASTISTTQDGDVIALQLQVNALEEKRSRLGIFLGALDNLETLPAADPDYLHPSSTTGTGSSGSGGMFEHCSPLPEMPKELMEGFTRDTSAPQHEIETMMRGLHKAVLRNKLLAQREKRKLDALREEEGGGGGMNDPSSLPADVQLHALSAVKDHLISWIETQLMQAGDEDEDEDDDGGEEQNTLGKGAGSSGHDDDGVDLDTRLGGIQQQYDNHIALRREIRSLLAEADQVSHDLEKFKGMRITASSPDDTTPDAPSSSPTAQGLSTNLNPPATLVLTPYLERLQQASREQKALVQEKSHINSTIAKQQQHMSQTIQDLVEASSLLAAYPNAAPSDSSSRRSNSRTRSSFGDATRRSGSSRNKASVATQVEPFVYSADSAKIATLEAVVDKIELGQMAVEEARGRLDEVRRFLDKPDPGEEPAPALPPSGHKRRNTEGVIIIEEKSIWSKLDGNLGLIND